jgi:hypothetical protein
MSNSEIAVLTQVLDAMATVDEPAARRIIGWLLDKYGMSPADVTSHARAIGRYESVSPTTAAPGTSPAAAAADFATLFADASPATDRDSALVAGYWFQVIRGEADLDGQTLNRELKNLGHGVGNITKAMTNLMRQDPQLVIQTRKSGGSAQARKKYRLTRAGITQVEGMLAKARG